MGGQHGILQCVGGIVGVATGEQRQPVQLPLMAVEQLLERIPVTGDVGSQQLGVGPLLAR
jgi:hypothetical protein